MTEYGTETAGEAAAAFAAPAAGKEDAPEPNSAHVRKLQRELKRQLELNELASADLAKALAELAAANALAEAAAKRAEELDGLRLVVDRQAAELRAANKTAQNFATAALRLREALGGALTTIESLGRLVA